MRARDLIFRPGSVELVSGTGRTIWASDSDEYFRRLFRELPQSLDADKVIAYLIDRGAIPYRRKTRIRVLEARDR